jgi:hypothetical protein
LIVPVLVMVLGVLAFAAAPALAAGPPETPETGKANPATITATTATLEDGVLNPHAALGELAEYEYRFRASATECEGEGATAGMAAGEEKEVVPAVELAGLQPDATYTFCLFERSIATGETSLASAPEHFETLALPPEVLAETENASPVRATEATLNAIINANNEETKYAFEYSTTETAGSLTGTITTVKGAAAIPREPYAPQLVSVSATGLQPNTTYYYRVVAENAQSEKEPHPAEGAVKSFTTATPSGEQATAIAGTTVTLNGVLNPVKAGEADSYEFRYKASPTECEGESVTSYVSVSGGQGEAVKAEVTGLLPHTTYTFCLLAFNERGEEAIGSAVTFTTSAVGITGEASSEVGTTFTKLSAQIDPGGAETTYSVEYGTSEAYSSSTPVANAGAGSEYAGVQATLAGLQPDTVYHYRFVANSSFGTAPGPDATFTTFPPSVTALPDNRAYELVSDFPAGQDVEVDVPEAGANYFGETGQGVHRNSPFDVASGGEAVVYPGYPLSTGGFGGEAGNEFLATRSPGGGWTQVNLETSAGATYEAFSSDLSVGVLSGGGAEPLAAGAPKGDDGDLYAHSTASGAEGEYHPFYTGIPPNQAPGETLKTIAEGYERSFGDGYAGTNAGTGVVPAFSHLLFEANDALATLNVEAAGGTGEDPVTHLPFNKEDNLYDSAGGGLYLVNVLPDGETEANASFGSPALQENPHGVSHVISADGSRIFWTDLTTNTLYVRENDTSPDASTVPVAEGGKFWTASSEGSLVFYTKEAAQGDDLYEFDVETGQTTDLAPGGEVQGVLGASEDGEYIYFIAQGKLASNENANNQTAKAGEDNLYLSHAGKTTFIGTLSREDGSSVTPFGSGGGAGFNGDWQAAAAYRTAQVTPDGHSLVFMSNRSLTGYDNAAQQGLFGPEDEVFLYEAPSGTLRCVSCDPSGEPPVPTKFNTYNEGNPIGGFIPLGRNLAEQMRVISDDGSRVFFDSGEPLVPTDTNGWLGVYEWERAGTSGGSCPADAPNGGCVYLLSSGTEPESSWLLGTDASGDNAFFISRAQLVPQDRGRDDDVVYDARVDGVQPPAVAACEGTGCQGVPPTPPIFATPSSATITGGDDLPPPPPPAVVKPKTKTVKCAKGKKRNKHNQCVKVKTKRKKAKKTGRVTTDRRAK